MTIKSTLRNAIYSTDPTASDLTRFLGRRAIRTSEQPEHVLTTRALTIEELYPSLFEEPRLLKPLSRAAAATAGAWTAVITLLRRRALRRAAIALLMFGGSSVAASAQTTLPANHDCPIRDAAARPATFYAAEPPLLPELSYIPNGTAIVRFRVTENGTPLDATIEKSSGSYVLDRAAMNTVLHQQFVPEIRDCIPVAGSYLYEVDY